MSPDLSNTGPTSSIRSRNSAVSNDSTLPRGNFFLSINNVIFLQHTRLTRGARLTGFSESSSESSSEGVVLLLTLDKAPVAGEPIRVTVHAVNKQNVPKTMKVHFNAQAKEYNHSPLDTFWETHGVLQLAPLEGRFPLDPRPRSRPLTERCGFTFFTLFPPLASSQGRQAAHPSSPVRGRGGRQHDQSGRRAGRHGHSRTLPVFRGVQHRQPAAQD